MKSQVLFALLTVLCLKAHAQSDSIQISSLKGIVTTQAISPLWMGNFIQYPRYGNVRISNFEMERLLATDLAANSIYLAGKTKRTIAQISFAVLTANAIFVSNQKDFVNFTDQQHNRFVFGHCVAGGGAILLGITGSMQMHNAVSIYNRNALNLSVGMGFIRYQF